MANVAFKKGLLAALPSIYTEGTFYVTTDERAIYLDVDNSTRIRIGDFQEVANMEALEDITNPDTTALYYVKDINVLAKYNGASFVQINLDTGATSVEVVGSGNAVTQASYDPASRKLTLTMGATYTTAGDVDAKIAAKVGEIGDDTVKAYVDKKTEGIASDEALTQLGERVTAAEGDIDALEALVGETPVADQIDAKITALNLSNTYEAKGAAATAKTELIGDAEDTSADDTIKGAKKYADEKATAAQTAAETHADEAIAALDVVDTPVATQLVSAVSETDGKITVTRRPLVAEDIPEIAQSKVTGLTTALAGKQDTLVFNTAYNADSNKAATMTDVQNAVEGLSGAMHYVGESTTDPSTGTATVEGHEDWVAGDVVTYQSKEYVYDGENWRELGDESSFAVKGSIKNGDIAADAAIAQSKIAGLTDALAGKATPADITTAIGNLDVADDAVAGQLVSAVVETDGKIAVSRRALVADDIPTLAIAKVSGLQDALDGKAVESDITDAIAALDVEDTAVNGQVVSAVSETDGKVTVTRRALVATDIPELAQDKITGLTTALAGKQDTITFETAYNASTNKAATMTDVDAAETAAKAYTDTALTWGSFDDLT